MKGLACRKCGDIRALTPDHKPVWCYCGNSGGWWIDGARGVARYTAVLPAYLVGMGFNNSFLSAALSLDSGSLPNESWRKLHHIATDAPGYLFNTSQRDCWAIFFTPGTVRDVEWATNEERAAVGLPPYPMSHALAPKTKT